MENILTFVNFTDSLKDKDGYSNRSLYISPVHFNIDGQMLIQANIAYVLSEHHVLATAILTSLDSEEENDEKRKVKQILNQKQKRSKRIIKTNIQDRYQ